MVRWISAMLVAAVPLLLSAAASAQAVQYRSRTVLVFGADPCPVSTNPDEIIVCARRPEEERYRIPKDLREQEKAAIARQDQVGANRDALVSGRVAGTGIGSCSAAGAGGSTGCTRGIDIVGAGRRAVTAVETATEPTDD